jgi:hypothetical protein
VGEHLFGVKKMMERHLFQGYLEGLSSSHGIVLFLRLLWNRIGLGGSDSETSNGMILPLVEFLEPLQGLEE